MAALLFLVLAAGVASGSYIRFQREVPVASSGPSGFSGASSGSSPFSGASSSSFSSSSGTKVAPGPGGYGSVNAFSGSGNFGPPPSFGGGYGTQYADSEGGMNQPPYNYPGFPPFGPQYGQSYPFTPFPTFAAPFDFLSFLNQYFQSQKNFLTQAEAQAQQAAASGHGFYHNGPGHTIWAFSYPRSPLFVLGSGYPADSNEVGGAAMATYGPQGGYGSANIFPKPEGGSDIRFGGDDGTPNNSVDPVGSVSGSFRPPGGNSFGVFSSSSSGSSDINGKKTSYKQSTIGINDNGKVTTYTAHDP